MTASPRSLLALGLGALFAVSATLLASSPTHYRVDMDALMEVWGDVIRDVDAVVRTARISSELEARIGDDIHREMSRSWSAENVPEATKAYVAAVGARVAENARRLDVRYRFHVVDAPHANAWAIPGGHVYITTRMLELIGSEAELAAVLGHEVAHIDLRHCVHRVQTAAMLERMGLNAMAFIVSLAEGFVGLGYSEVQEAESDRLGFLLAASAGYDPLQAFETFRSFHRLSIPDESDESIRGGPESELLRSLERALSDYFATHPAPIERLDALRFLLESNALAWEGRTFFVGAKSHEDRASLGFADEPYESRVFSKDDTEYLVLRAEIAHLLGRTLEAERFVERMRRLHPNAEDLPRLDVMLKSRERT